MPRGKSRIRGGRRGRPSALARISTTDLHRELERRRGMLQHLTRRRNALASELSTLDSELSQLGAQIGARRGPGRPPGPSKRRGRRVGRRGRRGPGRPRKEGGLVQSLASLLRGKTLSVSDAADQVQKLGYKTKSSNFRTIVNQALLANRSVFRKVSRGKYTAR